MKNKINHLFKLKDNQLQINEKVLLLQDKEHLKHLKQQYKIKLDFKHNNHIKTLRFHKKKMFLINYKII